MRRGRLAGAVLVALFLVTGCSDPQDPPTTPPASPSASPSPSPTPSPTPPPTPDASVPPERPDLSEVNAETAEALATYFLELYPYVFATADLSEWRDLSHPDCVYCAEVAAGVHDVASSGDLVTDGRIEVLRAQASETVPGEWWLVQAEVRQSSASDPADSEVYDMAVIVVHEGQQWLIRGVEPKRRS